MTAWFLGTFIIAIEMAPGFLIAGTFSMLAETKLRNLGMAGMTLGGILSQFGLFFWCVSWAVAALFQDEPGHPLPAALWFYCVCIFPIRSMATGEMRAGGGIGSSAVILLTSAIAYWATVAALSLGHTVGNWTIGTLVLLLGGAVVLNFCIQFLNSCLARRMLLQFNS